MPKTFLTQAYKGTRDFYPDANQFVNSQKDTNFLIYRQYIFDTWRKTLLNLGFVEYDCSIIEQAEIYLAKSGEELGGKQLYNFHDKSDRHIALRPEMTPSLARMVADKYNELRFPLRWFSIPNCFRYEAPQKGRLREFWQLNVDIIGQKAGSVDLEMMFVVSEVMKAFGASQESFKIKFNHRQVLDEWIKRNAFWKYRNDVYDFLDDYYKIIKGEKENKLSTYLNDNQMLILNNLLSGESIEFNEYAAIGREMEELENLFLMIENSNNKGNNNYNFFKKAGSFKNGSIFDSLFELDPTIVRGLAYYTGLVFECFDNHQSFNRALFGGGRYDNLLDLFDKPKTPAIGFGMGDVPIMEFLQNWNLLDGFENFETWKKANQKQKVGIMPILDNKKKIEKKLSKSEIEQLEEILRKLD